MTMQDRSPNLSRRSLLRGTVSIAGVAVVLPAMGGLAGCSSTPPSLAQHEQLIAAVVDRIIPQTETGGALAAGVPEYIASLFEQHFSEEQQHNFVEALQVFDNLAIAQTGSDFSSANAEAQDKLLAAIDTAGEDADGKAIWQQLRDITIFGFYTSQIATQELAFEELPGRYEGCVPLSEVGGAWLSRGV